MFSFGSPQPFGEDGQWRQQLDWFVRENQQELAALSWGLFLEKGESDNTLGIDIEPILDVCVCQLLEHQSDETKIKFRSVV
jgi:hypothetical protein